MTGAFEGRCWSVAPDGSTECEREHAHGGRHQRGAFYWERTSERRLTASQGWQDDVPVGRTWGSPSGERDAGPQPPETT